MADIDYNEPNPAPSRMRCLHRGPSDDFFCLRYQVWYPSPDCAIRTKFKTSNGCLDCEQGRFNLKRHSAALRGVHFHFDAEE
ncbi:MAG: hypothetical protein LAO51_07045 [Acidobacteriia bacterium]|nr:hypothetical protein [Terriglobia bacterium]